jgi:hypothetical protein
VGKCRLGAKWSKTKVVEPVTLFTQGRGGELFWWVDKITTKWLQPSFRPGKDNGRFFSSQRPCDLKSFRSLVQCSEHSSLDILWKYLPFQRLEAKGIHSPIRPQHLTEITPNELLNGGMK